MTGRSWAAWENIDGGKTACQRGREDSQEPFKLPQEKVGERPERREEESDGIERVYIEVPWPRKVSSYIQGGVGC